jgi:hypothetical protein
VTSCALVLVSSQASGVPLASVIKWCLPPSLRRINGARAGLPPKKRPQRGGFADRRGEIEASFRTELGEQAFV